MDILKVIGAIVVASAAFIGAVPQVSKWFDSFHPVIDYQGFILKTNKDDIVNVISSITFINDGSKAGCVLDLAFQLRTTDNEQSWTFVPVVEIDLSTYLENLNTEPPPPVPITRPFSSIRLEPKMTSANAYIFAHKTELASQEDKIRVENLSPDTSYIVELWTAQTEGNCTIQETSTYAVESGSTRSYEIKIESLEALINGIPVILLEENLDNIRTKLAGTR